VPTMPQSFSVLVRSSGEMQAVCRLISRVAFGRHPVVIMGESGTGKGLPALHKSGGMIGAHRRSMRKRE
jgi:DNA-binding NtrC family response regulator